MSYWPKYLEVSVFDFLFVDEMIQMLCLVLKLPEVLFLLFVRFDLAYKILIQPSF